MPSLVQVLLRKDADDIAEVFARVRGRRHSEPGRGGGGRLYSLSWAMCLEGPRLGGSRPGPS